jgi:hypothetical protein
MIIITTIRDAGIGRGSGTKSNHTGAKKKQSNRSEEPEHVSGFRGVSTGQGVFSIIIIIITIRDAGIGRVGNKEQSHRGEKRSNQINQRSRNMFRVFAALVYPRGCFCYDHYYHHAGCGNRTGRKQRTITQGRKKKQSNQSEEPEHVSGFRGVSTGQGVFSIIIIITTIRDAGIGRVGNKEQSHTGSAPITRRRDSQ